MEQQNTLNAIWDNIIQLSKKHNLTDAQTAVIMDMPPSRYTLLKEGKLDLPLLNLVYLCQQLKVKPSTICTKLN
ncbi:MAG: hypothetical protein ISR65_12970 [Bacteriovoracaceae bacterium]|nr:hypothetical protein [Bacteriovoracaceae bacterium]